MSHRALMVRAVRTRRWPWFLVAGVVLAVGGLTLLSGVAQAVAVLLGVAVCLFALVEGIDSDDYTAPSRPSRSTDGPRPGALRRSSPIALEQLRAGQTERRRIPWSSQERSHGDRCGELIGAGGIPPWLSSSTARARSSRRLCRPRRRRWPRLPRRAVAFRGSRVSCRPREARTPRVGLFVCRRSSRRS